MRMPRVRFSVRWLMVAVAAAALLLGVMAASLARQRAADREPGQSDCTNTLMIISLGLQNYCELHGRFPPPFVADQRGRPMHSWRLLAIPVFPMTYPSARAYDYAAPWDAPINAGLSGRVPTVLSCPSEYRVNPGGSPFV